MRELEGLWRQTGIEQQYCSSAVPYSFPSREITVVLKSSMLSAFINKVVTALCPFGVPNAVFRVHQGAVVGLGGAVVFRLLQKFHQTKHLNATDYM